MDDKITGVFKSEGSAILAIKRIKMDGYSIDEISVIAKQKGKSDKIEDITDKHIESDNTAGALGGIGTLLVEFDVFSIPGIGQFLAIGPIAVTLAGIIAGGSVGGVSGALIDMGFSETDAQKYENLLNEGNIIAFVNKKYS